MRKFTMIFPSFWTGRTGRDLRATGNDAQLVALYLLSCPHANYIGMYRLPVAYIAADLDMSPTNVMQTLSRIEQTGFARYDEATETVWIVEGARHQIGKDIKAEDKRVKMIQREFESLPSDCVFLDAFYDKYAQALKLIDRVGMTTRKDEHVAAQEVQAASVRAQAPTEVAVTIRDAAPAVPALPVASDSLTKVLRTLLELRDSICPDDAGAEKLSRRVQELAHREGDHVALHAVNLAIVAGDYDMNKFAQYEQSAIENLDI